MAMNEVLLTLAECETIIKIIESYNNGRTMEKAYWDIYNVFHNSRRPDNDQAVIKVKSPNYDGGWATVTMDYVDEEQFAMQDDEHIFHLVHTEKNGSISELESVLLNDFLFIVEDYRDTLLPLKPAKTKKKAPPKMDKLELKAVTALGNLEGTIGDLCDEVARLKSILKAAGIKY
jgi:hypothetical protein